eukprot:m.255257 g.255257  ORF g.255257 m.255257 type:complete len:717 (+) comp33927_c0_seq11:305-2455(+)
MATVSTFAGDGNARLTNGVGTAASFSYPRGIAMDSVGTMFVAAHSNHCIRKITADGVVTTFAGTGAGGFADGAGEQAQFNRPYGVCVNDQDVVFVADTYNHRIRRIAPDGTVSTLAGSGTQGYQDGNGVAAVFNDPRDVVIDGDGNVLVADTYNHRIRKITADGVVTTLAGDGGAGHRDGDGAGAQFQFPSGLCVDSEGVVYVADYTNHRVRRITRDGQVSTVAGSGQCGHSDGHGTTACFNNPSGVAVDGAGSLFVTDCHNHRIRKIAVDGQVTTVAGTGGTGFQDGDGNQALFESPWSLTIDDEGSIFVTDCLNHRIRKITGVAAPRAVSTPMLHSSALTGTFADRTQACTRHIANVERNRVTVLTTHADAVATAHAERQRCLAMLQQADAKLAQAQQDERDADVASLAAVADARVLLEQVQTDREAFEAKVVAGGLSELNTVETHELLLRLGVQSATLATLQAEKVDGSVLVDLSEDDMALLNMQLVGDRRRLTMAVRRLANHQGFPEPLQGQPGALSWDCDAVGRWLATEGFASLVASFAHHMIDGAVLLTLEPRDLTVLGVATLGEKSALKRKLAVLKKQTYSGQVVGLESNTASSSTTTTTTTTTTTPSAEHLQAVLTAVLEENVELQQRNERNSKKRKREDTEIDRNFLCPILCDVMQDPVMAMDGHTYERAAIETWFERAHTSPMTNLQIPPTLVPNIAIRSQIANLK